LTLVKRIQTDGNGLGLQHAPVHYGCWSFSTYLANGKTTAFSQCFLSPAVISTIV